jgi:hypothetical protein
MIDTAAPRFGLPASLWVPIAAASIVDIETYVGTIWQSVKDPSTGRVNAIVVVPRQCGVPAQTNAPIWKSALAQQAVDQLFPPRQVWVHVDYSGYRQAYSRSGMPPIPAGYFLDHVQNRKAIGLRNNSHPFLRLCPVHHSVNTSAGHAAGGEGMERQFLATQHPTLGRNRIIYADPMDLTKMLDIPPGTQVLNGVRDTQQLFYP